MKRVFVDANIIIDLLCEDVCRQCLDEFFNTEFAGGHHQQRIEELNRKMEKLKADKEEVRAKLKALDEQ